MNKEDQSKKIILHSSVISVKVQDNAITHLLVEKKISL